MLQPDDFEAVGLERVGASSAPQALPLSQKPSKETLKGFYGERGSPAGGSGRGG